MSSSPETEGSPPKLGVFNTPRFKKIMRMAGTALSVISIAYVAYTAYQSSAGLGNAFADGTFIALIAIACVLYAAFVVVIAVAFHVLLSAAEPNAPTILQTIVITGRSQILKYLPSNVLHLVGRYAMARDKGVSHAAIGWSTLAEAALIVAAAGGVAAVFALPVVRQWLPADWANKILPIAGVGIALGLVTTAVVMLRWDRGAPKVAASRLVRASLLAILLYVIFFVMNGLLFGTLVAALSGNFVVAKPLIIGLFAAAWVIGFVFPGAPAGIGIREAVLTSGLQLIGAGSVAVPAAIAYRIVTLGGDLLFALVCSAPRLSVRDKKLVAEETLDIR